jgi:hypothetical protein
VHFLLLAEADQVSPGSRYRWIVNPVLVAYVISICAFRGLVYWEEALLIVGKERKLHPQEVGVGNLEHFAVLKKLVALKRECGYWYLIFSGMMIMWAWGQEFVWEKHQALNRACVVCVRKLARAERVPALSFDHPARRGKNWRAFPAPSAMFEIEAFGASMGEQQMQAVFQAIDFGSSKSAQTDLLFSNIGASSVLLDTILVHALACI